MIEGNSAIAVLRKHDALLVHCAGFAKMLGNLQTDQMKYLERLKIAANGGLELACSTVQAGDWTSIENIRNYTGPCGLVLRPSGTEAVTYTSPTDAGSQIGEQGRRAGVAPNATVLSLEQAITFRPIDRYNEVGVLGYEVVGVFIDRLTFEYSVPACQVAERLIALGNPSPDKPEYLDAFVETITFQDVMNAFSDLDIFSLQAGTLHWLMSKGQAASGPVTMDYIYGRS